MNREKKTEIDRESSQKKREKDFFSSRSRIFHSYKDVTIAASSQIFHGQTVRSSPIFGYVCGLRTVTCDDAIADERLQNLGPCPVQNGICIAPYLL